MPSIMKVHDALVYGRRLDEELYAAAADTLWVLPMHSTISPSEQQKVFQRPQYGRVKVVLSTNICETSITIDDVVCVIDSARVNETGYDAVSSTATLSEVWCSQAARRQRAGRCGMLLSRAQPVSVSQPSAFVRLLLALAMTRLCWILLRSMAMWVQSWASTPRRVLVASNDEAKRQAGAFSGTRDRACVCRAASAAHRVCVGKRCCFG
jgi:hypothetical protein